MEQIVVKTEVQPNGEILLFYVDENAVDANGDQVLHLEEGTDYEILEANEDEHYNENLTPLSDQWSEEEMQKLIIFYYDNKDAFLSGATQQQHLWAIACKTMLTGRSAQDCVNRLDILKKMYAQQRIDHEKGYNVTWSLYELCNQAFYDDSYVNSLLMVNEQQVKTFTKLTIPTTAATDSKDGIIVVKTVNTASKKGPDDKVETMLKLYLRYKKQKEIPTKAIWETIALELGEESSEYWHKRFLNFKQHYLRMLSKRSLDGPATINWPYMALFDEIFKDDPVFQSRHAIENTNSNTDTTTTYEVPIINIDQWNDTECTVLGKYYFDCFHEFQDETIPKKFLWTEVGRLLDKKPDDCQKKYEELKEEHYNKYFIGGYNLRGRKPLEIIYDNIISKEVELELVSIQKNTQVTWSTEELDELVKFIYQNVEMFKDEVCYFVCWACISRSLKKSIHDCRKQWEELKMLYKSILNDKMENSDMQIDWRYIELFDRIFDYGMDTNLLNDYEKIKDLHSKSDTKIGVKMVNINLSNEPYENGTDDEEFDERGFTKRTKRGFGDSKAFKILEYYQKNKEKFSTTQRKKQALWEILAKQIGISAEQCAHRFRNLKQVYTSYVQREINKPDMPIIWPYYALCKKVFGYRAIKSKLKNNKMDPDEVEEWTPKEIKLVINYFKQHYNGLTNSSDLTKWRGLAQEMHKTETAIRDKFNELKKSYKSLKTVKEHNPAYKVTWKYFNMFDEIYQKTDNDMEVEALEEETNEDEDDYQCIIVIPEDGDLNDLSNAQIIIKPNSNDKEEQDGITEFLQQDGVPELLQQDEVPEFLHQDGGPKLLEETKPVPIKWTKKSKRRLLILYHNYIKSRKGQSISRKEMWNDISSKMTCKTPFSCKKMFIKLKSNHLKANLDEESKRNTPYYTLMEKIMKLKPKFHKVLQENLTEDKTYKDVLLPANKVELALQYYLQHVEEFTSPKFEKKYLWTELANFVSEPVNKLYNKINYLKQNYNVETDEVAGEKTLFSELLREIITKENVVKAQITVPEAVDNNEAVSWSNDEIEQLLVWYLANLDKFKNPKFVRKYLWLEAYSILGKSPLVCSKKMTEIRTQYKTMIKQSPDELNHWRFYELCQKIYGTGKKIEVTNVTQVTEEPSM